MRLLLDERILGDGRHARTWASAVADGVLIEDDGPGDNGAAGARGVLSVAAVDRVMTKYGLPLDPEIARPTAPAGDSIALGAHRLRRLRHHAPVDATGRDYLVWERDASEPLAVIATHATAALRYLVLRLAGERRPSEI